MPGARRTTLTVSGYGGAMNRRSKMLLGLLLFNGLSATVGGLALMTDGFRNSRLGSGTLTSPATIFLA
jgi:hypothetical protein